MNSGKKIIRYLVGLGVIFLQLIMTQVVTFIISLFFPGMENFPQTQPMLFVILLGITFSTGVFLVGWLALRQRWLTANPKYPARLVGTLIGAYLPLFLALTVFPTLEPGNPFFLISMLTSILGFYIPGWIEREN